jgi:DNA-binding IclR family transcriptional regulator
VAFSPPATAKSIVQQTLKLDDIADAKAFGSEITAELSEIRNRGFAMSTGIRPEGFVGVAAPIISNTGFAVAAIGTYILSTELDTDAGMSVIAQIKAACARISHYLGHEAEATPLVG